MKLRVVQVEPGEWRVYRGDVLLGGGGSRRFALAAAIVALAALGDRRLA